jgi:hypothetical protein
MFDSLSPRRLLLAAVTTTAISSVPIAAPLQAHAEEVSPIESSAATADRASDQATGPTTPASAEVPDPRAKPRTVVIGFNIDLFPIIASATQKAFGFSGQLQLAIDRIQFRLVGAKLRNFAFFLHDGFEDYDTVVLAFLLDFFFRDDLSGFWITSGFEVWLNEIANTNTTSQAYWTNAVWTIGGGYVWRIGPHFFINPWVGMHVRMNNPAVELGGEVFQPVWVLGNASIKLGAYFDL